MLLSISFVESWILRIINYWHPSLPRLNDVIMYILFWAELTRSVALALCYIPIYCVCFWQSCKATKLIFMALILSVIFLFPLQGTGPCTCTRLTDDFACDVRHIWFFINICLHDLLSRCCVHWRWGALSTPQFFIFVNHVVIFFFCHFWSRLWSVYRGVMRPAILISTNRCLVAVGCAAPCTATMGCTVVSLAPRNLGASFHRAFSTTSMFNTVQCAGLSALITPVNLASLSSTVSSAEFAPSHCWFRAVGWNASLKRRQYDVISVH